MKGKLLRTSASIIGFIILLSFSLNAYAAGETTGNNDLQSSYTDNASTLSGGDVMQTSGNVSVMDYGAVGDGVTNDSAAVKKAFDEAQKIGGTLYFPAGRYNINGLKLKASKEISLAGDEGGGSVLLQPKGIDCYASVKLNDLEIVDDEGVFLNLVPKGAVSLQVDSVKYSSAIDYNNKTRFIYCSSKTNENYYTSIEVTNCDITNVRYGIQILCRIDSGLVSDNRISQLGNPNESLGAAAIKLGYPNSSKVFAKNVTVSNNRITDIKTAYAIKAETCEAQGIILYGSGGCVIENNYLENIVGGSDHEGIYTKSPDVKIMNNTLINAGDGNGAIVSKCNSQANDIIISGNTIMNDFVSERVVCGIYVSGEKFTITDNSITMKSGIAICKGESYKALDVLITGNIIETQGRTGIYLTDVIGKAVIKGNTFTHNSAAPDATVNIAKAKAGATLDISDNTFRINHIKPIYAWKADKGANIVFNDNIIDTSGKYNEQDIGISFASANNNAVS